MKKKFKKRSIVLLLLLAGFVSITPSVFAVQGSWYSAWGYDVNGVSSVGTTNAEPRALWFEFKVIRTNNSLQGHKNQQLGTHQSYTLTTSGSLFADKQGIVHVSPGYYHTPWFNA